MAGLETVQQVAACPYAGALRRFRSVMGPLKNFCVPRLGFVLVASAQSEQLQAARDFRSQLEGERYEIEGMILNRVRASLGLCDVGGH